ncbi:hypothetical protein HETIRDRAFT_310180 [Heterobasidion irregulare TC 32-1]|uniref:Uncharacterized protein n=1 Tax=Heterobasidion irregulare (strain TC 32-1) TaxID=747525 RepID=W4KH10_HETIT|nr:uncharacterized protein HETIRDRAFT_310180 [Heterobasidion irregulare TC 32-1]ETW85148.1 hypothetical protein HETIRDRAFT_310180 [Heterobasidion irregulare TC 32-1]
MVSPYPNNCKPLNNVWQYLGQFVHTLCTYHDCTGVIKGALQCPIMGLGSDSPFGQCYPYPVSPYCLLSQLPHVQLNAILHHCLAIQAICLPFLPFYWLSSACSYYLCSDDRF